MSFYRESMEWSWSRQLVSRTILVKGFGKVVNKTRDSIHYFNGSLAESSYFFFLFSFLLPSISFFFFWVSFFGLFFLLPTVGAKINHVKGTLPACRDKRAHYNGFAV